MEEKRWGAACLERVLQVRRSWERVGLSSSWEIMWERSSGVRERRGGGVMVVVVVVGFKRRLVLWRTRARGERWGIECCENLWMLWEPVELWMAGIPPPTTS